MADIVALGLCSAVGQVFIFITIAKFGALTVSLMSLTRKVTTLTASIIIYDHDLSGVQLVGLLIALLAMAMNFVRPKAAPETVAGKHHQPKKVAKGGMFGKLNQGNKRGGNELLTIGFLVLLLKPTSHNLLLRFPAEFRQQHGAERSYASCRSA